MAREKEERITFKCELHRSINEAEVVVNRVIEHLWGEKWPPTPHRTNISATEITEVDEGPYEGLLMRDVTFTFARLPYETVRVCMWKGSVPPRRWQASWVIIKPNPSSSFSDPRLESGPLYVEIEREMQIFDSDSIGDMKEILEGG